MVCNAATSYARAPVSLVAPLLPRIPQRIYSSLSGVVSPLFGRSGWTDGLAGSSDRGPGALLASGGALAAALPPATLAHRERDVVRRGAASVNAALDRLKGAAPPWSARAVFVAATQGDDFYAGRQVTLGAWGPRAAVLDPAEAPAPGAGVAFYRRPDAFGFEFRGPSTFRDDRLHWNLDRTITTGGWFAGEALQFGGTGPWRKLLLYRE